ncbi:MAG TPA: trigger factor, partial [Acidobacteriota bacterium]|nr:trigger factor [Acidobacteriota bacterium]
GRFLDEIRKDAADSLVPKAFEEEMKAAGLRPASVPVIRDAHYEDDGTLHAVVDFEVMPEFALPAYAGIRLERREPAVEDTELEAALEDLRQRAAEYIPAEGRGAADGDYVVIEVQGRDLKTKKAFPLEKAVVLAGHAGNEAFLNENLPGMKPGEEKAFKVAHPAGHPNKKLAGKDVEYRLKVQSVKEKKLPPLDDDLARTVGDFKSLDELKDKLRERLLASKRASDRNRMASDLLVKISPGVEVELPESLVAEETRAVLKRILSAYPQTRLGEEQARGLATEGRKQAEQNIRNNLVLSRIAEKEGIAVTEPEVEEEMKRLAEANQVPLARVVETVNKEGRRGDIEETLLFGKTIDFLLGQAIIE